MIPDFIPIEITSMSVFSAMCFCGVGIMLGWIFRKTQTQDEKIYTIESNLNDIRVDIAETKAIVQGISNQMSDFASINKIIIQSRLGDKNL